MADVLRNLSCGILGTCRSCEAKKRKKGSLLSFLSTYFKFLALIYSFNYYLDLSAFRPLLMDWFFATFSRSKLFVVKLVDWVCFWTQSPPTSLLLFNFPSSIYLLLNMTLFLSLPKSIFSNLKSLDLFLAWKDLLISFYIMPSSVNLWFWSMSSYFISCWFLFTLF